MGHEPLFECDRDYIESPCKVPPPPMSRADALFLLSLGGQYCLEDVLCFLGAYVEVLNKPDLLKEKAIVVTDNRSCRGIEKTPVRYLESLDELSVFFSGFKDLGIWLSDTYTLLSESRPTLSKETVRCLDIPWMEGFAKDTEAQHNIGIIECLRRGVLDIIDYADRRWNVGIYWVLVLEHLTRAAGENNRKYGADSLLRDKNNRSDRKKLFKSLKEKGLFDVRFKYFTSPDEDEEEVLDESFYQPKINCLKKTLLSRAVWSISEVCETLEKEIGLTRPRGYPETAPYSSPSQQIRTNTTSLIGDNSTADVGKHHNSPPKDFSPQDNNVDNLDISCDNENNKYPANAKWEDDNLKESVVLLKIALRYFGKDRAPIAREIMSPKDKDKKSLKKFLTPLATLTPTKISRAKKDMELEGYKFVRGYKLKSESYDRLKIEVDARLKIFMRFIKQEAKRRSE